MDELQGNTGLPGPPLPGQGAFWGGSATWSLSGDLGPSRGRGVSARRPVGRHLREARRRSHRGHGQLLAPVWASSLVTTQPHAGSPRIRRAVALRPEPRLGCVAGTSGLVPWTLSRAWRGHWLSGSRDCPGAHATEGFPDCKEGTHLHPPVSGTAPPPVRSELTCTHLSVAVTCGCHCKSLSGLLLTQICTCRVCVFHQGQLRLHHRQQDLG